MNLPTVFLKIYNNKSIKIFQKKGIKISVENNNSNSKTASVNIFNKPFEFRKIDIDKEIKPDSFEYHYLLRHELFHIYYERYFKYSYDFNRKDILNPTIELEYRLKTYPFLLIHHYYIFKNMKLSTIFYSKKTKASQMKHLEKTYENYVLDKTAMYHLDLIYSYLESRIRKCKISSKYFELTDYIISTAEKIHNILKDTYRGKLIYKEAIEQIVSIMVAYLIDSTEVKQCGGYVVFSDIK